VGGAKHFFQCSIVLFEFSQFQKFRKKYEGVFLAREPRDGLQAAKKKESKQIEKAKKRNLK